MLKFSLVSLVLLLAACDARPSPTPVSQEAAMALSITSTAFAQGKPIPSAYTCDGKSISPPLAWSGAPAGARSLALIMDDPDAPMGTFVHWIVYNIPAESAGLPEAISPEALLTDGTAQGQNSARRTGYTGPCPPGGKHRYFFKLFALDTSLSLSAATKETLLQAMQGHILAQGELMGTYSR